jgi:ABC-type nitrate/sulfonate/bicarbonate transport system permease component
LIISKIKLRLESLRLLLEPWFSGLVIVATLLTWEGLSHAGLISPLFFPPPTAILHSLGELIANGKILAATEMTLSRLGIGLALGFIPGVVLGLAMGWLPRLRVAVDPLVATLHPIPKIAVFPLIMIIFGIGEASKIVAIAIAAFFPALINSMAGVRQLNPVYFEVTKNFHVNNWKTFSRVIFPGSLPMILTGARLAVNVAMVIAIAVELSATQEGLGVMIWFAWQTLRIEELYSALVVIAFLGVAINLLLQFLSTKLAPWYHQGVGEQV